jgi:hypothetical protein
MVFLPLVAVPGSLGALWLRDTGAVNVSLPRLALSEQRSDSETVRGALLLAQDTVSTDWSWLTQIRTRDFAVTPANWSPSGTISPPLPSRRTILGPSVTLGLHASESVLARFAAYSSAFEAEPPPLAFNWLSRAHPPRGPPAVDSLA